MDENEKLDGISEDNPNATEKIKTRLRDQQEWTRQSNFPTGTSSTSLDSNHTKEEKKHVDLNNMTLSPKTDSHLKNNHQNHDKIGNTVSSNKSNTNIAKSSSVSSSSLNSASSSASYSTLFPLSRLFGSERCRPCQRAKLINENLRVENRELKDLNIALKQELKVVEDLCEEMVGKKFY